MEYLAAGRGIRARTARQLWRKEPHGIRLGESLLVEQQRGQFGAGKPKPCVADTRHALEQARREYAVRQPGDDPVAAGVRRAPDGRAAFLWERLARLADAPSDPDPERGPSDALARWRHVCAAGDPERFERRLRWDGLTPEAAVRALEAAPSLDSGAAVPGERRPSGNRCPADDDIPFAALPLPLCRAARARLGDRLGAVTPPVTDAAYAGLERSLVDRLVEIAGRTLFEEFSVRRPQGSLLLERLVGSSTPPRHPDADYRAFVSALAARGGIAALSARSPLLSRFLTEVTDAWVDSSAELLTRLAADREVLAMALAPGHQGDPGHVVSIRCGLSDPHQRGRMVATLAFESGLRVVYKPRPLGVEAAWGQFLAWCRRERPDLGPEAPRILDRGPYGWAEYVEHRACGDGDDLGRFSVRTGALLSLLHALGGTDAHFENVIARGGQPVLVDAETVLQPRARPLGPRTVRAAPGCEWFERSVLRTGLLPRRRVGSTPGGFDPCGLGGDWLRDARRAPGRARARGLAAAHPAAEGAGRLEHSRPGLAELPAARSPVGQQVSLRRRHAPARLPASLTIVCRVRVRPAGGPRRAALLVHSWFEGQRIVDWQVIVTHRRGSASDKPLNRPPATASSS